MNNAIGLLQQAIDAQVGAGVVVGISSPDGTTIGRIDYAPTATAAQQAQVQQVIAGFNMNIVPRSLSAIMTDIAALTAAQQATLFQAVAAQMILANPNFAVNLGIAVSGDQTAAATT